MGILKSVRTALGKLIGSNNAAAVVDAGLSVGDKLVSAIKASPTGAQIAALVAAANESGKTGAEKMADVLAAGAPLVLELVTAGGAKAAIADVEAVTRNVVESVLTDLEATKAGTVVTTLLGLFGIKI